MLEKRILPRFGATKVRSIRAADIDAFYADLQRRGRADGGPLGAQSIHHIHALLHRLLNQAVRWGWIATSLVTRAGPPRVNRHELTIPKPEVVAKLIKKAEEKDCDLASFPSAGCGHGARRGELCAFHWDDIDLKTAPVRIARSVVGERNNELADKSTKTHASRRISLDRATLKSLESQRRWGEERARAIRSRMPAKASFLTPRMAAFPDVRTGSRMPSLISATTLMSQGSGCTTCATSLPPDFPQQAYPSIRSPGDSAMPTRLRP